jgi:undecaprenyl diphosphate synthase
MTKDERLERVPQHIAIIMDGNGRWALKQHLPRIRGHAEGVKRVEEITQAASDLGIKVLTLYVFSTENWLRPQQEVSKLMSLLCTALSKKLHKLIKGNIRLHIIGKRDGVAPQVLAVLDKAIEETKENTGLILNLAFNYGSRTEIVEAVKDIVKDIQAARMDITAINEEVLSRKLYTRNLPDPDLLIRTSGEFRISNFLLWQLSYAELYFTDKYWPEFTEREFRKAIQDYQKRERRYGKT